MSGQAPQNFLGSTSGNRIMSEEERNIELIDRYLSGELTPEQKLEVERLLSSDKNFSRLHDDMKIAFTAIRKVAAKKSEKKLVT